jgi:hypothetical protein
MLTQSPTIGLSYSSPADIIDITGSFVENGSCSTGSFWFFFVPRVASTGVEVGYVVSPMFSVDSGSPVSNSYWMTWDGSNTTSSLPANEFPSYANSDYRYSNVQIWCNTTSTSYNATHRTGSTLMEQGYYSNFNTYAFSVDAPPVYPASVDITFPLVNVSSSPYPDFTNWVVSLQNLGSDYTYEGQLRYYLVSSTVVSSSLPGSYWDQHDDWFALGNTSSAFIWAFPKTYTVTPPFGAEVTYLWQADFYLWLADTIVATDTVQFYTKQFASNPTSTSSYFAGPFMPGYLPTSTIESQCGDISNATSIGNGIFTGFCKLLVPSDIGYQWLQGGFDKMKSVPPFSMFFTVVNAVSSSVPSSSSTQPTLALSLSMPLRPGVNSTSSIILLSSSTNNAFMDQTTRNWWFNIVLMCCLLFMLYGATMLVYHSVTT